MNLKLQKNLVFYRNYSHSKKLINTLFNIKDNNKKLINKLFQIKANNKKLIIKIKINREIQLKYEIFKLKNITKKQEVHIIRLEIQILNSCFNNK